MSKIYTIAEIGQAHDGSLGIAHSFIDALASTGIDAIKFQIHIAEAESSIHEPFRTNFSYQDKTRTDYWKRTSFDKDQWMELKNHCNAKGLDFIASPGSNAAVDLLQSISVQKIKIGSGDVGNLLLLQKAAYYSSDIILSSGMSSMRELDQSINFLKKHHCRPAVLQCASAYPAEPRQWGLNMIQAFRNRYDVPVGLSDHSGDIYAGLAAAASGAEILEFHVVFDKRMFGPDSGSSLNIEQVGRLVDGCGAIHAALQNPVDKDCVQEYHSLKSIFEKSLSVNRNLQKGDSLRFEDLEGKKPAGKGIPARHFRDILGKKLNKDLKKWDFVNHSDLL